MSRHLFSNCSAKIILSEKTKKGRIKAAQTNTLKRLKRQDSSILVAEDLIKPILLSKEVLFLIASLAYECEGGKSNFGVVEFTNSDPTLVRVFLCALRKSFKLDELKFRVVMHLHSYHNEASEKRFWSDITGIPKTQFTKTFQKQETGINKKTSYRGCVQIKYFDVNIKRTLLATKVILAKKMGL
jgi:hypothetical protein